MHNAPKCLHNGLAPSQAFLKRAGDIVVAIVGLMLTGWVIAIAAALATIDTGQNGFFTQRRIGRHGRPFRVIKIRTMRTHTAINTVVTTEDDPRITHLGRWLRKTKLDELPQLINVLIGHMSLVGPRPDVPGFADQLSGDDRIILSVRPGITGPATLRFRHEEKELARQVDAERYNRDIIFPEKVRLNREYVESYSFAKDIKYLILTVCGSQKSQVSPPQPLRRFHDYTNSNGLGEENG
jgi:lipopolysaccharide/colanic/teichoic acid biosynthesis glycosyltransferase